MGPDCAHPTLRTAFIGEKIEESELLDRCAERIQRAVDEAESMDIPGPESQFDDVFASSNWMLDEQRDRLLADIRSREPA